MDEKVKQFWVHTRPSKQTKHRLPWIDYTHRNCVDFYNLTYKGLAELLNQETFRVTRGELSDYINPNDFRGCRPAVSRRVAIVANPMSYSDSHCTLYPFEDHPTPTLDSLSPEAGREVCRLMGLAAGYAQEQNAIEIIQGPNTGKIKTQELWEHFQSCFYRNGELIGPFNIEKMADGSLIGEYQNPRKVGPEMYRTLTHNEYGIQTVEKVQTQLGNLEFVQDHLNINKSRIFSNGVLEVPLRDGQSISTALTDPRCYEFLHCVNERVKIDFFNGNPNLTTQNRAGAMFFRASRVMIDGEDGHHKEKPYKHTFIVAVAVKDNNPVILGLTEFGGIIQVNGNTPDNASRRYFEGTQPMVNRMME
jgi:hypothetical protein